MPNLDLTIDLSYLHTIAGGDAEFIGEMIDMFTSQTPIYISDLQVAVNEDNWTSIGSIAHKIKPTLAFVGVNSIMEVLARIELNAKKLENLETIKVDFALIITSLPQLLKNIEHAKAALFKN